MAIMTNETYRLAMQGDICCKWEVLNVMWNSGISFDTSSPWGKTLNDMSQLAPHHEVATSDTIEILIIWLMWMYHNEIR
jgi:hypothetical protein